MKNKEKNVLAAASHHDGAYCAEVLSARTEPLVENEPVHGRHGMVKVPVVLAETKVQVDIEALIKLPEPALEIKRIKKKVFITQCKFPPNSNKLFLGGFVRKNIEYATVECATPAGVGGVIKHATVDVPFECVTKVDFVRKPIWIPTTVQEYEVLGERMREIDLVTKEHLNEKIFCELVSVRINELDHELCGESLECGPAGEITFCNILEKMEVDLCLKVLQYQQVKMGKHHKHHKHDRC